jgi:hypothetical protein
MTKTNMRGQVPYIKRIPKTFYEFRVIEIVNEREIKEHFSFVFPYYGGGERNIQHMFFSNDLFYMIERLVNARAFIYKQVPLRDRNNPTRVKWELVHRFT